MGNSVGRSVRVLAALALLGVVFGALGGPGVSSRAQGAQPLVAFTKGDNVWLMNADGSDQRKITSDGAPSSMYTGTEARETYPWYVWSPDGAYLLIVHDHFGPPGQSLIERSRELLLYEAATGSTRSLAANLTVNTHFPAWDLDGDQIVFMASEEHPGNTGQPLAVRFVRLGLDGSMTTLVETSGAECGVPEGFNPDPALTLYWEEFGASIVAYRPTIAWSSADDMLIWSSRCASTDQLITPSTGAVSDLGLFDATIGPDGRIAGRATAGGPQPQLMVAASAGDGAPLASVGSGRMPVWASASGDLYFVSREVQGEPQRLYPAGGATETLVVATYTSRLFAMSPGGQKAQELLSRSAYAFGRPSPAADGAFVVYTRIDNSTRLWEHRLSGDTYTPELLKEYGPHSRIQRLDRGAEKETTLVTNGFRPVVQPVASASPGGATATPAPQPAATVMPGSAGEIAFIGQDGNIWTARPDGSRLEQITTTGSESQPFLGPRWSPDGRMLVAQRGYPANPGSGIFLFRDGTLTHVPEVEDCAAPAFSADGQRLLFTCAVSRRGQQPVPSEEALRSDPALGMVSSSALDGSDRRVEAPFPAERFDQRAFPSSVWSIDAAPDGAFIINFVSTKPDPHAELVTPDGQMRDLGAWSARFLPDGGIALLTCAGACHLPRSGFTFSLVRADREGRPGETLVTFPPDVAPSAPALDPSGRSAAYSTGRIGATGGAQLYVATIPDGKPAWILNGVDPAWQPAGQGAPPPASTAPATVVPTATAAPSETTTPEATMPAGPTAAAATVAAGGREAPGIDRQMACALKGNGHWDVWVYDFSTGTNRQLTVHPASDEWVPAWSHDGRLLAYLSDATDGSNQVWLMDPDGGNQRQVTDFHGGGEITSIEWGIDNQSLVLTVGDERAYRLMTVPIGGGDLQEYIPAPASYASISSFGRMAYVTEIDGVQAVALIDLNTGASMGGIGGGGIPVDTPDLAEDGQWLVVTYGNRGERRIGAAHLGRPKEHPIPASGGDDSNGVWLMSGQWIAYVSTTDAGDAIWAVPVYTDYGQPTSLTLPPHERVWYLAVRPSS